jgi:hypothetical protein
MANGSTERPTRWIAERAALEVLKASSSVFDFLSEADAPDRFALLFRGRGLYRDPRDGRIAEVFEHRCDVRLTAAYPDRPPEIRWQTPLLHPNISFSGFIRLSDVGLPWSDCLGLDVLCERLWDVARLAYFDLDKWTNFTARQWLETQSDYTLPLDPRPLRDRIVAGCGNVFRYQYADGHLVLLPKPESSSAVLFLDENTPSTFQPNVCHEPPAGEDEILYIGD